MRIKFVIGDWSGDGHSRKEEFLIDSNYNLEELQEAYKRSCKLTGLTFDGDFEYTGLDLIWTDAEYDDRQVCVEYEDRYISKLAESILLLKGIDVRKDFESESKDKVALYGAEDYLTLLLKFIKLSLRSFTWRIVKDDMPCFNISEDRRMNLGYGLFDSY